VDVQDGTGCEGFVGDGLTEERVVHLPPGCINSLKRSTSVNVAVTARGRRCVVGGRVAATDSICTCVINLCVIMTHKPGYGARLDVGLMDVDEPHSADVEVGDPSFPMQHISLCRPWTWRSWRQNRSHHAAADDTHTTL